MDLAKLLDKVKVFDFAKEMYFDERTAGNKTLSDKSLTRLLKSLAIMGFGISKMFQPANRNELCQKLNLLVQTKQAGTTSDIIIKQNIPTTDNLLEYKCISTKEQRFLLLESSN